MNYFVPLHANILLKMKNKQEKLKKPEKKQPATAQRKPASPWLKYVSPLACVAALVAIALGLLNLEDEFLWKVQELNLHLDTPLFFRQQMVVAGGLLTWLGTWFTEFFFHPVLGVGWLCLWWALLMVLTQRAFRVPMKWAAVLLVPVALLLITCVDMGYWIYYLKLRGHFFVATIGLCAAMAAVWGFRCLPSKYYLRPIYIVVSTAVLYPLTGFYGLLAALTMGVMAWRIQSPSQRGMSKYSPALISSVVAVLAIVVVPLLYYRFVFYQASQENIWWAALPLYRITEEHAVYYIPYYLLTAFFVAMAASYRMLCDGQVKKPVVWGLCHVALLAVLIFGVQKYWYRDYNFHKELRMQRCMEQSDWQGILNEATNLEDEPTRAIVMMKNLALFRLGRQGEEMYRYRTGAKACNTIIPVNMTQVVGCSIYFYYGLANFCYRWCLEDGVEYGWRAEYLKYMTRCALVNGEERVARKYLALLKHTRYHGEWAATHEAFLGNEEKLRADANFAPVFHLMNFHDNLNSDQSIVEQYLMHHFVYDPSTDKLYQDQSLNAALWMKDIPMFWPFFNQYAKNHPGQRMPTHYQEAAYLYGHLENHVDISRMPFDKQVKQTYESFMQLAQRCKGMTDEQMKDVFYPQFGKTYYFEYFLIRNQKLY